MKGFAQDATDAAVAMAKLVTKNVELTLKLEDLERKNERLRAAPDHPQADHSDQARTPPQPDHSDAEPN